MAEQYFTSFSTLVPRHVYQAKVLTDEQRIDLFKYFTAVHDRWSCGERYPYDLEELVPSVYSLKGKAVKALTENYTQDVDYRLIAQKVNDDTCASSVRSIDKYHLTCECFEHMVAKRNKAIFAVYSQIFHATVEERKTTLRPHKGEIAALLYTAQALRFSPSSTLGMMTKYFERFPTTEGLLPGYAVDAPDGGENAEAVASATQLLKERGSSYDAKTFNKLACQEGYIESLTRPSSREPKAVRTFWSITDKGLAFGKNNVSPKNTRETQPLWYRSRFGALLKEMNVDC